MRDTGNFRFCGCQVLEPGRIGDERTQKIQKVGYGFERIVNLVSNGRCHSARGSYLLGLEE